MADKNNTKNKLSIATYGINGRLDKESDMMSDIVKQTALEVSAKFGKRLENKIVDTYTNINLSNIFLNDKLTDKDKKSIIKNDNSALSQFKDMMQENSMSAIQMLSSEQGRIINYSNYKAIVENIPECASARDTYISNILSPDDYSKSIFNVDYNSSDEKDNSSIKQKIKKLIKKYHIEEKTEEIVSQVMTYGDCFVSVLPYDEEISKFVSQTSANGILNESMVNNPTYAKLDEEMHLTERMYCNTIHNDDMQFLNESDRTILTEVFGTNNIEDYITDKVNNNIKIRSVTELLRNKADADNDIIFSKTDSYELKDLKDNKKRKKNKTKFNINGSSIKILDPSKIIAVEVDDVCYGYYYIEEGFDSSVNIPYDASSPSNYAQASNPVNPSVVPQQTGTSNPQSNPVAKNFNISDDKLQVVSTVLLKAISKKLNKNYINDNKQFKDLLYNLLRQKYILEKGVSITYLLPEEVVHFKGTSIFEKVVFFAKIYLAMLTNTVIIKLGRGHDKRVFYVQTGIDNNYEQAIMQVVQNIKTKEFKMSNLGSISSILSLNPGIFDDMYIPVVNGEHPVDLEIQQGMDQEISNDFTEFLKKSIIDGTGVPSSLIDAMDSVDFAHQISAQNANFCRKIVRCQKQLTPGFEDLIRTLFVNEYKYNADGKTTTTDINVNDILISFPSPAALNLTNLLETFTSVESVADYISKRYYPDRMDQSTVDEQNAFKQRIIEDKTPQVDWEKYNHMYENFKDEYKLKKTIELAKQPPQDNQQDQYGGQY